MAKKYLDENGLLYFWQKIVLLFVQKDGNKVLSTNDYTTAEKEKLSGIEAGAEVNILEDVKVNGVSLVPTGKAVNVDLTDYARKADIAGGVHVKGSVNTYADLPSSGQATGDMYNVRTADPTHGIAAGDNVVWDGSAWDNFGGTIDLSGYATTAQLELKVDKVTGKGLSTNDYTNADATKLSGIETGAQVNVQSDWNVTDTTSAAFIKNKPTIPSGAVVDDHMDSTSENPVQNKVIVSELSGYLKTTDIVPITNAEIDTIVAA